MNRELTRSQEAYLKAGIAVTVLDKLGFSPPEDTPIIKELGLTRPSSSTAFYDSVITGIELILQLNAFLSQIDMDDTWNFVHIVLTDGEDTSSKNSLETAVKLMLAVGLTLKTSIIKTYFIGIDVEQNLKATKDIVTLTLAGGENAQFFQVSNVKIEDIFEKIRMNLGIYQQTNMNIVANENAALIGVQTRNIHVLTVQKQRYVVLFNLDASGSMSGGRWSKVCNSVKKFTDYLGDGDLVGGIIFNDKVKIITAPQEQPAYKPASQPTYKPTYQPTSQPTYKPTSTQNNHYQQYKQNTNIQPSYPNNDADGKCCIKCNIF